MKFIIIYLITVAAISGDALHLFQGSNGYDYTPPVVPFLEEPGTGYLPPVIVPPQQCPQGTYGQYPNCHTLTPPPPPQCPFGTFGQYPDCRTPPPINREYIPVPPPQCPSGTFGQYPDCHVPLPTIPPPTHDYLPPPTPQCGPGKYGQYPNCFKIELEPPQNEYLPPAADFNPVDGYTYHVPKKPFIF